MVVDEFAQKYIESITGKDDREVYLDRLDQFNANIQRIKNEIDLIYDPAWMMSPTEQHPIPSGWRGLAMTDQEARDVGLQKAGDLIGGSQGTDPRGRPDNYFTADSAINYLNQSLRYWNARKEKLDYQCSQGGSRECKLGAQLGGGVMSEVKNKITSLQDQKRQLVSLPSIYGGQYDPSILQSNVYSPESEISLPSIYGGQYVPGVEPEVTTDHVEPPESGISLPSIYGGQYVPGVEPEVTTDHVEPPESGISLPSIYGGQYVPGVEPEVTTDHVIPPDMPVEEPPMVTATEPGQVNWIPEPFFSFINNVFRR